jgi:hypothetical protein
MIADFGIAKMLGVEGSAGLADSQPAGTPQYMAPEQRATPGRVDHRADIYSLGVVFYEMLTGQLPARQIEAPSSRMRGVLVDVRLDEIVLRALEKTPELRYQTAGEFRTQVETMITPPGGAGQSPATGEIPFMAPRISRLAVVGACWVIMFFAVVPAFIAHEMETHEFWRHGPFASGLITFIWFVFLIPAFIAPFGATLLGYIAAMQISRASGRIYGLALAVFDGLLFPLLALDALIFFLAARGGAPVLRQMLADGGFRGTWVWELSLPMFGVLLLGMLAWIDYLIVRRVWRSLKRAPAPIAREAAIPDRVKGGEAN